MTGLVLAIGVSLLCLTGQLLKCAIQSSARPGVFIAYLVGATFSSVFCLVCVMHVLTLPYLEF